MANGIAYSIEGTSWPFGTRKEALKEAKGVWKMYVTEYGSVNPLIGIYANRRKIGFVSKGIDGKFYFFNNERGKEGTYPIKTDGTLGTKVKNVKFI